MPGCPRMLVVSATEKLVPSPAIYADDLAVIIERDPCYEIS